MNDQQKPRTAESYLQALNQDYDDSYAAQKQLKEQKFLDVAHEIWATAQLLPEEGIEDGVHRIVEILKENFKPKK